MPTQRQRLLTSGLVMPPSQWMLQLMDPDSTSMIWWARVWGRRPLNPVLVSTLHSIQENRQRVCQPEPMPGIQNKN